MYFSQTERLAFLESMWGICAYTLGVCTHTSTKHTNAWPTYICRRSCTPRIKDFSRLRCLQGLGYTRADVQH